MKNTLFLHSLIFGPYALPLNAWRAKDKRLFTIQNSERPKTL
jgi:hypothetical protein